MLEEGLTTPRGHFAVLPKPVPALDVIHVAVDQHRVAALGLRLFQRVPVGLRQGWRVADLDLVGHVVEFGVDLAKVGKRRFSAGLERGEAVFVDLGGDLGVGALLPVDVGCPDALGKAGVGVCSEPKSSSHLAARLSPSLRGDDGSSRPRICSGPSAACTTVKRSDGNRRSRSACSLRPMQVGMSQ